MTLGSIFLSVALLVLVGVFIARPVLIRQFTPAPKVTTLHQTLLAQKESLLAQVRILDFDFETGKLPEGVYKPQRQALIVQAAGVLQELDQQSDQGADIAIEAAIAALRQTPVPVAPQPDPPVVTRPVKFCPQCGEKRDVGDKFCAYCGGAFGS